MSGVAPAGEWNVERREGTAQELHDADPGAACRQLIVHEVTRPAVVLGSTQRIDGADAVADARGLDLARRRSGGGAVLLVPGAQLWVDVVVPAGDPLWEDDVERASWWLGDAWAAALAEAGAGPSTVVHRRGVSDRELGRAACFAALGPGEVEVAGRKVVGISQRRTRAYARFQCVVYVRWDPTPLLEVLGAAPDSPLGDALLHRAGPAPGEQWWRNVEGLRRQLP